MMNSTLLDDPEFAPTGSARTKAINPLVLDELTEGERLIWVGQPRRSRSIEPLPAGRATLCLVIGVFLGFLGLLVMHAGLFDRPTNVDVVKVMFGLVLGGASLFLLGTGSRDQLADESPSALFRAFCLLVGTIVGLYGIFCLLVGFFDRPHVLLGHVLIGFVLGMVGIGILGIGISGLSGRVPSDLVFALLPSWFRTWLSGLSQETCYALTDQRIILWEPAASRILRVRSWRPNDLSGLSRTQAVDGSGDVILEIVAPHRGKTGPIALGRLRGIDRVREVEALIRSTLFPD